MDIVATRPAQIHGLVGVELKYTEYLAGGSLRDEGFLYGAIENDQARWLAVLLRRRGAPAHLSTFLDDSFAHQWGPAGGQHPLANDGVVQIGPDGSHRVERPGNYVAGVYQVEIGSRRYDCFRVVDPGVAISEYGAVAEAYVDVSGRTVYYREFHGRHCSADNSDWLAVYPDNERLVINGCTYVHVDCTDRPHEVITHFGIGLPLGPV
jgi:hypothetical protein